MGSIHIRRREEETIDEADTEGKEASTPEKSSGASGSAATQALAVPTAAKKGKGRQENKGDGGGKDKEKRKAFTKQLYICVFFEYIHL